MGKFSLRAWGLYLGLACLALAEQACVEAQLARRGNEVQLNTFAEGDQTHPQVAALPDGGFFVVWNSDGNVVARRFALDSAGLGPELAVNETPPVADPKPRLAASGNGSVLVIWSALVPPNDTGIFGRLLASSGEPAGSSLTILDSGSYEGASVGSMGPDTFVVAWTRAFTLRAAARTVTPAGGGPIFEVVEEGNQLDIAIGSAATERFQMVWYGEPIAAMQGRPFASNEPAGSPFFVAAVNSSFHDGPTICSRPSGGFVVSWATQEETPHSSGFLAVRYVEFDAQSVPLSSPRLVTPDQILPGTRLPYQSNPSITCGDRGDFTIVWLEYENPSYAIRGKRYLGGRAKSEFRIGLDESSAGFTVARLANGDDLVAWSACSSRTGCEVFAQRFADRLVDESAGDCDRDGSVTIADLVLMIRIVLSGDKPALMKLCLAADIDLDYRLSIGELVLSVNRSLGG